MTMLNKGLKPVLYDKDKAVSPIIATILLVAITVILASTLYLALGGFFTAKTTATPSVGLSSASGNTAGSYVITVGSTSTNTISWSNVKVEILSGSTVIQSLTYSGSAWANTTKVNGFVATITSSALGTYVTSGDTLNLQITTYSGYAGSPPTTIEFFYTGSGAGSMGSTSL